MGDSFHKWLHPETYVCETCGKEEPGHIGFGNFGEGTTVMPQGWWCHDGATACSETSAKASAAKWDERHRHD